MGEIPQSRSLLSFFGKKLVVFTVVLVVGLFAMMMAIKITGCTVVVGDAFAVRTEYVLTSSQEAREELSRFFTAEYITGEELETERKKYEYYTIVNYGNTTKVTWVWVWPWSSSATLRAHYQVRNIAGDPMTQSSLQEGEILPEGLQENPPVWENGIYSVRLQNQDGQWKVTSISLVKADVAPALSPSPTPTDGVE